MIENHMIRNKTIALTLVLCSVLALTACPLPKTGKSEDSMHKAAAAALTIQTVTDTAIDSTAQLFHDGIIDKVKTRTITLAIQEIHNSNGVLINSARSLKADTAEARCILSGTLLEVVTAIQALKDAGVLGIKSATGVLVFDTLISGLKSDVQIVAAVLGDCAVPASNAAKEL